MKIIAEAIKKRSKVYFVVKVVEGNNVIEEETATTINKRDQLIWGFAEQYNTTDIAIVSEGDDLRKKRKRSSQPKFKFSEIPSIPVLDMEDAADYFDDNEDVVYNRVIVAVKEGIDSKRDVIRLFELNGTGVYITSEKSDWESGLENAKDFFEAKEEYEKCAVCVELLKKL